jgi:hypothetical protein
VAQQKTGFGPTRLRLRGTGGHRVDASHAGPDLHKPSTIGVEDISDGTPVRRRY